jgi:hypothetical protein
LLTLVVTRIEFRADVPTALMRLRRHVCSMTAGGRRRFSVHGKRQTRKWLQLFVTSLCPCRAIDLHEGGGRGTRPTHVARPDGLIVNRAQFSTHYDQI